MKNAAFPARPLGIGLATALVALLAWALLLAPAPRSTHAEEDDDPPATRQEVFALIAPRPGERIADLGCGRGRFTFPLARAVGQHGLVYAVDISRDALAHVRKRIKKEGIQNIQVVQSIPDDPMLTEDSVDVVFLNDVIDVVDRRALPGLLEGIRRSLREGGRLVIRDPKGGADRVIAECYRAGFNLVEAKVPLPDAGRPGFGTNWYGLKFQRSGRRRHSVLTRLGRPARYHTRVLIAEELYRAGVIDRGDLRGIWDRIQNRGGRYDPAQDEPRDLIRAAEALEVLSADHAAALRKRLDEATPK